MAQKINKFFFSRSMSKNKLWVSFFMPHETTQTRECSKFCVFLFDQHRLCDYCICISSLVRWSVNNLIYIFQKFYFQHWKDQKIHILAISFNFQTEVIRNELIFDDKVLVMRSVPCLNFQWLHCKHLSNGWDIAIKDKYPGILSNVENWKVHWT